MTAALRALEVKLAEAKAPSRELDGEIACIAPLPEVWADENRKRVNDKNGKISFGKHGPGYFAPGYTSSLDAAVAFAEAMFPEQTHPWEVHQIIGARHYIATLEGEDVFTANASTPALALCLATIRALLAKETG